MSRVEHIGDATLILGDCREVLPTLGIFDACITDPPYGIGAGTGIGKVTKEGSDFRGEAQWDDSPPPKAVFDLILDNTTNQIIWGGNYFDLPPSKCFLVWDKIQPEQFTLAMAEMAWTNIDSPAKIFRWKSQSINGGAPKYHPTQKPLDLMAWCLKFVPSAHTIIDPYLGSGTTGVACAQQGLRFTGIEREEKYFDIACDRIARAYSQRDLFIAPPTKPVQEALW